MLGWFHKLRRWAKQYPESFAGAILWVSPFLSVLAYSYDGIVGALLLILLLAIIIAGTVHLGGLGRERIRYALRCTEDVRAYLQCGCSFEFNTCPVRKEKACHCLCHRMMKGVPVEPDS